MQLYTGVVENRQDPQKLGRCQVRVVGLHTHDKLKLKTEDLPWAYPMQPITSAAMSGIGHSPVGPVEGTWVVIMFRDDDEQMPIILGTVGGIPQEAGAIDEDPSGIALKSSDGTTPSDNQEIVSNNDGNNVTTSGEETPTPTPSQTQDIPRTPPQGTSNPQTASTNIEALLAACDKVGLTTKEQKCTVLALAGGESGWIPKSEGYNYSAEALMSTFASTFAGKPELAAQYARWKGTRESFFNFVYSPDHNGSALGNTQANDGGKYYGRGFIQLTGRYNYQKYTSQAQALGLSIDLITNPDTLNSDINTSAIVACLYVKNSTPSSVVATDNPGYFYAAKRKVGNDTGEGAAKRATYYAYFYGEGVGTASTGTKDAGAAQPTEPQDNLSPAQSSKAGEIGFKDPNSKYPLPDFMNEPDTNRLARGISKGTVVPIKDSIRAVGIPKALSSSTFDEPVSSFSAKYPFNHVFETESGHVQEWDDTPGHERTHTYHRKGTFTEVDPNGTEIHHIVGDSYTIIDRNGCIYVTGECNLTADGNINIMCRSNANVEVLGDASMKVGGNFNIGVGKNMTVAVGGSFSLQTKSSLTLQAGTNVNILAIGGLYGYSNGSTHLKASGNMNIDGKILHVNSGTSKAASSINLTIPSATTPLNKELPYLVAPAPEGEEVYKFESEEDWATPEGQAAKQELEKKHGVSTPENTTASESATASGGSSSVVPASCNLIMNTETFTSDFRLSEHFTLGMLFDGGFNCQHKLVNQNGLTKQEIVCNLSQLCQNILEVYLSVLPGGIGGYGTLWKIGSGYRQGASSSQHNKGQACDVNLIGNGSDRKQKTFDLVQKLEKIVPYDQIILEYRAPSSNWIHTSYSVDNRRKMAFTMLNDSTYKRNSAGQPAGFYLL